MKTLSKLSIKPENFLENNELKKLKGGSWSGTCWIYNTYHPGCYPEYWSGSSQSSVQTECNAVHNPTEFCECG